MEEVTFYVKLKAKNIDFGGYITYVFEDCADLHIAVRQLTAKRNKNR